MKVGFDDPQFSFQTLRMLGSAGVGMAEVGEVLRTAERIAEGDFDGWHREWQATAERVRAIGDDCSARGHRVSAREAWMRASNYFRAAEFYLHGNPDDPRIVDLSRRSAACFDRALDLLDLPIERLEIPYEATTLPGLFYRPERADNARPTLLLQTGYDGTIEELHPKALAANRRGWNCLTFEGPGQGRVIREQGLPFRHDWEQVVTPIVDFMLARAEVDPKRIALEGMSLGGYLAPRAAAFEHRLAACIANGGVYDFMGSRVPEAMTREQFANLLEKAPDAFDAGVEQMVEQSSELRWAVEHGMFVFKASRPADWMRAALRFELSGVAEKIRCPTLVIDAEEEASFEGEAQKLYDALTCSRTFMLFTREEGAEDHCQVATPLLAQQRIFDWLEETMASV
jgi:alpha-beta hydrolase superfamily lysophospholipase